MSDERHYGYGSNSTCGTGRWNKSGSGYDLCGSGAIDGSGQGCGSYYGAAGLLNFSGDGSGIGSGEGNGSGSGKGDDDSINLDFLNL